MSIDNEDINQPSEEPVVPTEAVSEPVNPQVEEVSDILRSETVFEDSAVSNIEDLPELLGPENKQKIVAENIISKVDKVNSNKELNALINRLTSLPPVSQLEYLEYLTENKEVMQKLHEILQEKNNTDKMTDEDFAIIRNISLNNSALDLCEKNVKITEKLSDENSQWQQNKGNLRLSRPGISKDASGVKLTGSQALGHMRSAVGLSNNFWMPLYNSGFWINLEAPSEYELVVLLQKIGQEKTALGTESAGGVFSNSSCFLRRHVVDLLASKIITSSLRTDGDAARALKGPEVISKILITDYADILTRFMALKYSKGYPYLHTCSNYTKPCNESNVLTLNLHAMVLHDYSRLSPAQEEFMLKAREPASVLFESDKESTNGQITSVVQYRNAFKFNELNTIRLSEKLDLVMRVPTIMDTITEGDIWMNEIKKDIDNLIKDSATFSKAENMDDVSKMIDESISALIDASGVRRYSQWVSHAVLYNTVEMDIGDLVRDNNQDPNYVYSRPDIYKFLADLIKDDELIDVFINGYHKFVADSCMTVVGYPQFECPACKSFQGSYEEKDKKSLTRAIIPFEAEENFFILLQG